MSVWIKKVKICFLTSKRLIGGTLQWAHMLAEAQDAPALSITQVCTSLCKSRHPAPAAHSSAAVPAAGYSQLTTKRLIAAPFPLLSAMQIQLGTHRYPSQNVWFGARRGRWQIRLIFSFWRRRCQLG